MRSGELYAGSNKCDLSVYPKDFKVTLKFDEGWTATEIKSVADKIYGLLITTISLRLQVKVTELRDRIASIVKEMESEDDNERRLILGELLQTLMPPLGKPLAPFPVLMSIGEDGLSREAR